MKQRKLFWTITVAVAVVGLAAGSWAGFEMAHQPRQLTATAWAVEYTNPTQMARGVDAIVVAKPVSVSPGRVATSTNGEDKLPYEVVELEVVSGLKGAARGETLLLERVGGDDTTGHTVFLDADGGPLTLGQPYLLFLKQQEKSPYFFQVNDQARFVVEDGRLAAPEMIDRDDPVVRQFAGLSVAEAQGLVSSALRPQGPESRDLTRP